jgi:hypothetical protein
MCVLRSILESIALLSRSALFLGVLLHFLQITPVIAGKKKVTIHTFVTEQWQESDYLGAGYHVQWDRIRPNIWVRVHRVEGEVTDTVGLPNNAMAGQGAEWDLPYDRNNLFSRIPNSEISAVEPDSGECTGGGRCFGDWVNNEETWEESRNPGKYKDSEGDSFLTLTFPDQGGSEPHGQRRTRFRFDVFVEDNTPYWLRDNSGGYSDWDNPAAPAEPYYPFRWITFRITSATDPATDLVRRSEDLYFTERNMEKAGDEDIFKINDERVNPIEKRVRWGKHIYSFTESFSFPVEGLFHMEVNAEDMEGNGRNLRVPISIGKLGGIKLQDRSTDAQKSR